MLVVILLMRVLLEILFLQTWVLFILVTVINAYIFKSRSQKYIATNPELEEGYKKMFKGLLYYGNVPWIIIGIGNLAGLTNSTFEYLAPRQLNPIVLVFHLAVIVLWVLSLKWIYFQNGAEFLEQHPGLLRPNQTARQIKIFFSLSILGAVIAMILMWVKNPSIPKFYF